MRKRFMTIGDGERQACGLLSGQLVASFCVKLPALPPSKLDRALPHIMSDYLTSDAGDLVFCHMPTTDDKHIVFACARHALDALIDEARDNDLELQAIWPDYMTLAQPENGIAIAEEGDDIIARRADGSGFRLPKALAAPMLTNTDTHSATPDALPPTTPGFATGRYGTQLPLADMMRRWRRPLVLAAAALIVWLGAGLNAAMDNQRQRDAMEAQAETRFMTLFPETRRIVNLESQLRTKLGMSGGASFGGQVTRLLSTLAALPNIRLEEMAFDAAQSSALEITLSTTDFSALETARLRLVQAGFGVTEGKSEQSDDVVIGRFNLSPSNRGSRR
ncbi:MAG: type II secretion system protein GspL [Parvibaculales bacterium]